MNRSWNRRAGFTITEVLAAATILLVVISMSLSGFVYTLKASHQSDIQDDLDVDVQIAMERLKRDLRLSSLSEMYYYPAGAQRYTAISFPKAYDDDGDGAIETNGAGKIVWDETLVYHVWSTSPQQLRLTTFRPRNNSLLAADCQAQLEKVVAYGCGTNTDVPTYTNASTIVVFENLFNWTITPQGAMFNGYDPDLTREVDYVLGSTVLSNGAHTFKFTLVGKDASASNYYVGLDTLVVSPSYYPREAEAQRVTAVSGSVNVVTQYMSAGTWSGNYQLLFPATTTNWSLTLLMSNDVLEATNFRETGETHDHTTILWDTRTSPSNFGIMLDGDTWTSNNWNAPAQTGGGTGEARLSAPNEGNMVRVLLRGSDILDGNYFSYDGGRCAVQFRAGVASDDLKLTGACIARCADGTNPVPDIVAGSTRMFFSSNFTVQGGSTAWSGFANFPIEKTNSYLVTFQIANSADNGHVWAWKETSVTSAVNCWVIPFAAAPAAGDYTANWSSRAGVEPTNYVLALQRLAATYPTNGLFTSPIYDTHMTTPGYQTMWVNTNTFGSDTAGVSNWFKIRSADNEDMSDASGWTAVQPMGGREAINPGNRRYFQYQYWCRPSTNGFFATTVRDVQVSWTGTTSLVDIGGTFTKGPDYGIFKLTVDGVDLSGALNVDLEIFRDTIGFLGTRRISSSLAAGVQPRNSGK